MSTVELPKMQYSDWSETRDTLHLFLQIVGKVRMASHPKLNHWWHVTLYPSVRGLTTGRVPFEAGSFEILFDFFDHRLIVTKDDGQTLLFSLKDTTVAGFYEQIMRCLSDLGIAVEINPRPYDNKSKIPFPDDNAPRMYDAESLTNYWRGLCFIASVFEDYRGQFVGKQTPVQLYWHSMDLVVTRFSGRAHAMTGGTQADREAYSHEVISAGFWPGDDSFQDSAFYAYAYPEPEGLDSVELLPDSAHWIEKNGGALAILLYNDVRESSDPRRALLSFLRSIYDGAARLSNWPLETLHKSSTH